MKNNIMQKISGLCLELDKVAFEIYSSFSKLTKNTELKKFWAIMAAEEQLHLKFWQSLHKAGEKNRLPDIFDEPELAYTELKKIIFNTKELIKQSKKSLDISSTFFIAYKLEFNMLHPAFEMTYYLMRDFVEVKMPEDSYQKHIDEFLDMFTKYTSDKPELEMLGKTLQRLWKENRALALQTSQDSLTEILNRRAFFDLAQNMASLAQRNQFNTGLLMIDIDKFKDINDQYGHQKGDMVLKSVAQNIKKSIRSSDLVGRYGGEEFIVFLSEIKEGSLFQAAEKIRVNIEASCPNGIRVTVSIGAAEDVFPAINIPELEPFIKKADANLYEAKATGRNKVVY
ncbi:diguanylate cyclase [bacterium]|nr:diguanylate cyclase [bacterium]MBT4552627.1 diguanylate cyclase [bacterium]